MILPKQSLLFSLGVLSFFNSLLGAPIVNNLSSSTGPSEGGNVVLISGNGFNGTEKVNFGTTPASVFTVLSDDLIAATAPEGMPGTVDITVHNENNISPNTHADRYTYQGNWLVCATNGSSENNFFSIDATTNTCQPTVSIDGTPVSLVMSTDGKRGYLANFSSDTVTVMDLATKNSIATLNVGVEPINLAITPDGKKVYVVNSGSNNISVIDAVSNSVDPDFIPVGHNPINIAITPNAKKAYVVNAFSDNLTVIDLATKSTSDIPLQALPSNIAIAPDGKTGYVTCLESNSLELIDINTDTVVSSIAMLDLQPTYMAITPNGKKGYISNSGSGTVSSIDLATHTINPVSIEVGNAPSYIVITPDSKTAYVAVNDESIIVPIDIETDIAGIAIPVETYPQVLAITPDQAPVAKFIVSPAQNNQPTAFDATASFSPVGTIASYYWNFGDGQKVLSSVPYITHTYSAPGKYNVTLTVTNSAGTSTQRVFSSKMTSQNGGPSAISSQNFEVLQAIIAAVAAPTSTPSQSAQSKPTASTPSKKAPSYPSSASANLLGNPSPSFTQMISTSAKAKPKVSKQDARSSKIAAAKASKQNKAKVKKNKRKNKNKDNIAYKEAKRKGSNVSLGQKKSNHNK